MTREETIEVLKSSTIQQLGYAKIVVNGKALSIKEAIETAIKALEQEPILDLDKIRVEIADLIDDDESYYDDDPDDYYKGYYEGVIDAIQVIIKYI